MVQYRRLVPSVLSPGTLYIVSTPIGNLEDITYRAVRVLRQADVVAAEDTRRAAKLFVPYGITTRRVSLHEHNETKRIPSLLSRLSRGETVAIVSDAGTPLVSDPGARLVWATLKAGHRVEAVPGPSAVLAALAASGLAADGFTFVGFPPYRSKDRKLFFSRLAFLPQPMVLFEAPHRIRHSLRDLQEVLGDRHVAICREITKLHETFIIGHLSSVIAEIKQIRGEFTIVVGPAPLTEIAVQLPQGTQLKEQFGQLTATGMTRREAIRSLATRYSQSTKAIYRCLEDIKADLYVD